MQFQVDAVYENGILRPLGPLELAEHQCVRITASPVWRREDFPEAFDFDYWETLQEQLKDAGPPPGLEEVRRMLSEIPGEMTDDFIAERGDR
jgi:predicted DNA-binding antitoxin AbrB/MazE fold protein